MSKKVQKWLAVVMVFAIIIALTPNVAHASESSGATTSLISESLLSRISIAKSYNAVETNQVKSVVGNTYSITVKQTKRKWDSDFDKGVKLGTVRMTTKIYYGGEISNSQCGAYVECKITVNPTIVKRNSDGSIQKCGVPQNIVVDGRFNQNGSQVAVPKSQSNEYQLTSSRTSGYNVSGTFGASWSKKDGFGVSGSVGAGYSSAVTTSISYPAKLITYCVNNNSGGFAHWEHKYSLSFISGTEGKTKMDMLAEVCSTNNLYVGLMGKLDTKYISTADYISSGYTVTPGYYVDWTKSNVRFKLSASFGGVRGSLSEVYCNELGSANTGYSVIAN